MSFFAKEKETSKSSIRIAWDASQNRFRSWTFDSMVVSAKVIGSKEKEVDHSIRSGGHRWTRGSAQIELVPDGKDRFLFSWIMDRTVDGMNEPDYEISVVRARFQRFKSSRAIKLSSNIEWRLEGHVSIDRSRISSYVCLFALLVCISVVQNIVRPVSSGSGGRGGKRGEAWCW